MCEINNLVGNGYNTQVVLFNLSLSLDKTSQKNGCMQALLYLYQEKSILVNTLPEGEFNFNSVNFNNKNSTTFLISMKFLYAVIWIRSSRRKSHQKTAQ